MTEKPAYSSFSLIDHDVIEGRRYTIVLYSHDTGTNNEVRTLLNESDFRLVSYSNLDGIGTLGVQYGVDLILLDSALAGGDICQVCSQIKKNSQIINVPILILLRECEKEFVLNAMREGADDFIHMPIVSHELLVRMRSLLGLHAWQIQAQKSRERVMIISHLVFGMNMGLDLAESVIPSLPDIAKHVDADLAFIILLDANGNEMDRIVPANRADAVDIFISPMLIEKAVESGKAQKSSVCADDSVSPIDKSSFPLVLIPITERKRILALLGVLRKKPGSFYEKEVLSLSLISDILAASVSRSLYLHEIARAHLTVKREFQMMGRLQKLLLPQSLPSVRDFHFHAYYHPALEAGGDYYDVIQLTEDEYAIVVADVSGHGAPAAMNMGIARSILHTVSFSQNISPAHTLYLLNKLLCRLLGEGAHITLFYSVLNVKERTFRWSNAGHVPVLIHRAATKEIECIGDPSDGPPLGWWNTAEFTEHKTVLHACDSVLYYTDGVIEAENIQNELYSFERLVQLLSRMPAYDPQSVVDGVVHSVNEHKGLMPLQDDLTLLAFQQDRECAEDGEKT